MILAEIVEGKKEALRVAEVARILDVSSQKIYRMAATGKIPTIRICSSIRFDPRDIAAWLRSQSSSLPIPGVPLSNHAHSMRGNGPLMKQTGANVPLRCSIRDQSAKASSRI